MEWFVGHPSHVYIEAFGAAEEPFLCLFAIPCEIWPFWPSCSTNKISNYIVKIIIINFNYRFYLLKFKTQ